MGRAERRRRERIEAAERREEEKRETTITARRTQRTIKDIEKEMREWAVNYYTGFIFTVLALAIHDVYGWKAGPIKKILSRMYEYLEEINTGRITGQDLEEKSKKEIGLVIRFEASERNYIRWNPYEDNGGD